MTNFDQNLQPGEPHLTIFSFEHAKNVCNQGFFVSSNSRYTSQGDCSVLLSYSLTAWLHASFQPDRGEISSRLPDVALRLRKSDFNPS